MTIETYKITLTDMQVIFIQENLEPILSDLINDINDKDFSSLGLSKSELIDLKNKIKNL